MGQSPSDFYEKFIVLHSHLLQIIHFDTMHKLISIISTHLIDCDRNNSLIPIKYESRDRTSIMLPPPHSKVNFHTPPQWRQSIYVCSELLITLRSNSLSIIRIFNVPFQKSLNINRINGYANYNSD